jgi:hypothetical protein
VKKQLAADLYRIVALAEVHDQLLAQVLQPEDEIKVASQL